MENVFENIMKLKENEVFFEDLSRNVCVKVYSNEPLIIDQLPIIIQSPKFIEFMNSLDFSIIECKQIRIDAVKWFCRPTDISPTKLGFLYLELDAVDKQTMKPIPGVVFLRGCSVAIYIIVEISGKEYVVLTKQFRAPIGRNVIEIPAGMMDSESCFAGVAMKEITEETGLEAPSIESLIPLGNPIIPSGGGCDEKIQLFFWKTTISEEKQAEILSKMLGCADENENIQILFEPIELYESKLMEIGDVKAICSHYFAKSMGLL
jgi:8-oxo-dGTP pyrophosphatase MutT (NUDIX family)